jgi:hypothetical protein
MELRAFSTLVSSTQTLDGYQIRKQEPECVEVIEAALAAEPSTRFGARSSMDFRAFGFEFLQNFYPELAQARPTCVDSAATEHGSIHTEVAILSVTPRIINEPGIVEIVLRVRVDSPRLGALDTHNRDLQQLAATTATSPIR